MEDTADAGIDIDHFCYDLEVRGNTIRRCGIGVEINDGSRCTVRDNTIEDCERGIVIWRWCRHEDLNVDNVVAGNVIRNSGRAAIHFQTSTTRNRAVDNRLIGGKGAGIVVEGAGNTVIGNQVEDFTDEDIRVTGADNVVQNNHCD
jgi:parallel beta-helix repeat protein